MKQDRDLPNPNNNEDTGSPETGGPVFINIGKLRRPHGISGEILLELMTDFPERLHVGKTVYLGEQHTPIVLKSIRGHGNGLLISFEGYDIREEVGKLTNSMVMVKASSLPALPDGEFYFHQLLGIQVFNESGQLIGKLDEVLETGANDV